METKGDVAGERDFYEEVMGDDTPGKVFRRYEWRENAASGWKTERVLLDGVIQVIAEPVYENEDGLRVRARRKELGLGLRQAATKLRLSPVRLSELEQGIISPTGSSSIEKILKWLEAGT
jgi:hypothetical protein